MGTHFGSLNSPTLDATMGISKTTFTDLPDELILEIVRYLGCIRSYEPQSTAFKEKAKEKSRQLENHVRQVGLYSLCLMSHRLRQIATPTLYASFSGTATWHGYQPLQLFHRTISNPANAFGFDVRLADFLEYTENRLCDYRGNNLYDDTEFYGAVDMISHYFGLLAGIVKQARNLQHLSVVSLETCDVSFWDHILPAQKGLKELRFFRKIAGHGLPKLKTLCYQVHTEGQEFDVDAAELGRVCVALIGAPSLTDLRASGVTSSNFCPSYFGSFEKLKRIEITECILEIYEVVDIWAACKDLQHIVCEWAYLDCRHGEALSDLYNGLLRHAKTLQTLELDMREVRFEEEFLLDAQILDSFRLFTALKSMVICETSLLGATMTLLDFPDQLLERRIAQLLPKNLESYTLLLESHYGYDDDWRLDEIFPLWYLAEDSKKNLPNLKDVSVRYPLDLSAPNLARAFEEAELQFRIIKET